MADKRKRDKDHREMSKAGFYSAPWKVLDEVSSSMTDSKAILNRTHCVEQEEVKTPSVPSVIGPVITSVHATAPSNVALVCGHHFGRSPRVTFGSISTPRVHFANDSLIVCVIPPHLGPRVQVTVVDDRFVSSETIPLLIFAK